MVSIITSVNELYKKDNNIKVSDLREIFTKANSATLSNALSLARRYNPKKSEVDNKFTKIDEEETEKVILSLLNERVDKVTVRMMIDFLKIKRMDHGLEDDLDIEKYLDNIINSKKSAESVNLK